jgi:signal transduction histidine kinase/CheY-like chemotaxis protein
MPGAAPDQARGRSDADAAGDTATAAGQPDRALAPAVEQALLDMAYGRLRQSVALTVIVCFVFLTLFWDYFPSPAKVVWIVSLLTISALRYVLWWTYQRADRREREHPKWRRLFFATAVAAGLGWAFGPVMLMPPAGHVESMLLVLAALSVSAVSMSAMSAQMIAMLCFQASILLPSQLALAATGGDVERLAAAVLFAGMVSLMIVGRASSAATRSLIETELRLSRAVADTSAARERAEAASHAKTRFLANMSHELRTPLNAVIGAAQLLRSGENEPQRQQQLIDAIQHSGTNLLGLIDNILDLSRIEAGKLQIAQQDFHLVDCIDTALATAGLAARAKGLQLACIVDPQLAPWRYGDAAALRQVLLNLLGNAVKFTPSGEIVVRVERGDHDTAVRLRVRDTGLGIEPQALAQVFEPFRQGDESSRRRFGGSGLGLAIVRQLTQVMGGQVAVSSVPGQGSEFELQLPLPLALQAPPHPDTYPWRVAYVEPHRASAQALESLLARMGCDAVCCEDAQALRDWCQGMAAKQGSAWLLLSTDDPQVPALRQLALQYLPPDRVLGMSGSEAPAQAGDRTDAPKWPVRVMKPVMRATLASCFVRSAQGRGGAMPVLAPDAVPSDPGVTREGGKHILVVEDDMLNRTIVRRMLQHAGCRVSEASDGHRALAILRTQSFDLVLMDWQMPDMDGLEVTRQMRRGAAGDAARQVPIVALTANAFSEDREACLQAGMDDFLSKPVLAASLVAVVERWTAARPARQAPGDGSARAAAAGPTDASAGSQERAR